MRDDYDVIIVGAGPAGSYSAICCAQHGLKTLLLEKTKFPRDKLCGGILEAKYFVRYAPFMLNKADIITQYTSLHYDYKKICVRPLKSFIYKRRDFDQILVEEAIKTGVEFENPAIVDIVAQSKNGVKVNWTLTTNNHKEPMVSHSKICIGADGINSNIRKMIGLDEYLDKHGKLVTLSILEAVPKDELPWALTREKGKPAIASYFYYGFPGFAWLAPGKDSINIGMGLPMEYKHQLKQKFRDFLMKVNLEHEQKNCQAYCIPYVPLKKIFANKVMLVGDAAGFVNPWTGGGINLGFESGKVAANVAKDYITKNTEHHGSVPNLALYQQQMKNTLKILRMKSKLVRFLIWCFQHKLTSPQWEQFILKHSFPHV